MMCNDDCSKCSLRGKALCPNKTVVINDSAAINDTKEFVRGKRAALKVFDDASFLPREVVEQVIGPFMVIGDEEKAYILPKPPDKPITIRYLGEWVMNSKDDYTIEFSRPVTDQEKKELIRMINNGEVYLEAVDE